MNPLQSLKYQRSTEKGPHFPPGSRVKLSPIQKDYLRAIIKLTDEGRIPPTCRELCRVMGVSLNAVYEAIRRLEAHGCLERIPMVSRGILVTESGRDLAR